MDKLEKSRQLLSTAILKNFVGRITGAGLDRIVAVSYTHLMIRMSIHGYVIKMDLAELKELLRLMQILGNNLNQYAKKANETGSIYHEDIEELKKVQKEILLEMRKVLEKLTVIM